MIQFKQFIKEQNKNPFDFKIEIQEEYLYYKMFFGSDLYCSCSIEIEVDPFSELSHIYPESKIQKTFDSELIVKLDDLKTDGDLQKEGIGTIMMNFVLEDLKKRNYKFVYLNACPIGKNKIPLEKLVNFYKKFQFKEISKNNRNAEMILKF